MVRPSIQKLGWCALSVLGAILIVLAGTHVAPVYFGETLLAQVGVSVGILPNPYNSLNDQLDQKQAYINEEQSYIDQQKAALASSSALAIAPGASPVAWYLALAVLALAVLVFLNFYLDWRRSRTMKKDQMVK